MATLLKIFKFAVREENKTQKLYSKLKNKYQNDPECVTLFTWLCNEESKHEDKLREKYVELKKELGLE